MERTIVLDVQFRKQIGHFEDDTEAKMELTRTLKFARQGPQRYLG